MFIVIGMCPKIAAKFPTEIYPMTTKLYNTHEEALEVAKNKNSEVANLIYT